MPDLQAALQQLARDEYKHAEPGWDILGWAVQQGRTWLTGSVPFAMKLRCLIQENIHRNGVRE